MLPSHIPEFMLWHVDAPVWVRARPPDRFRSETLRLQTRPILPSRKASCRNWSKLMNSGSWSGRMVRGAKPVSGVKMSCLGEKTAETNARILILK